MADFELVSIILAQGAGGGAAPAPAGPEGGVPAGGGLGGMLMPLLFMGLLFWFLLLRPAQKQEKERKRQIYSLKKGDEVAFAGGLLGTVVGIKEKNPGTPADADEVTLQVGGAGGNRLRALRSSIYQIFPDAVPSETKDAPAAT